MSLHSNCWDCRMSSSFLDEVQGIWGVWFESDSYDLIFPPNSRALLPTFRTKCLDGSHFALLGSHFAQSTTQNPFLYSAATNRFVAAMYVHKTPQSSPQNTPFPGLNLKVGKLTTVWAIWTPTGQNVWKVGQKKIFIRFIVTLLLL